MAPDTGLTDAQYGMLSGYAFYLISAGCTVLLGYVTDKYTLNRVMLTSAGSILTGAALVLMVRALFPIG
jgi:hypothetical protein